MIDVFGRWKPMRLLLAIIALGATATFSRAQTDPVEELRRVISMAGPIDENDQEAIDFRKTKIQEATDRMKSAGQLRRALVLDDWKVDPSPGGSDKVRILDVEMRRQIGERLKKMLEQMARQGNGNARLAVANMIAEMGPTVRSIDPGETGGYARGLTPLVEQMSQDADLGVRQEALRALGNINGPPMSVTKVFRDTLQKDKDVGPRRLAADGLQQLIKVVTHLQKRVQTATGVAANRKDLVDALEAVAPVAAIGVKDPDADVRMLSLQAVQAAGQALAELLEVPPDFSRRKYPPVGQTLSPAERARILDAYRRAETDLVAVKPMLDSLRKEVTVYAEGLRDPEPRVRLAATRAFENLGNARLRLVRRAAALPSLTNEKNPAENRTPNDLLKEADFLSPVLDREMPQVIILLRDPDVRIRRSAAEALEVLEGKAAPAIAGLILATQDPDRFVRWTAAKTLGYTPTDRAGPAVMPLAKLLSDPDLNVRIAAAASLEALGPVAKEAIPALAKSLIGTSDVEARLASMYALIRIGPNQEAIPALISCLSDRDSRIVKTACEVLAEIGPPAAAALPQLRALVGHDDADVRAWASEAMLSILRLPE